MTSNTKTFTDDELSMKVATAIAKANMITAREIPDRKTANVVVPALATFTVLVARLLATELGIDYDRLIDRDFEEAAESLK